MATIAQRPTRTGATQTERAPSDAPSATVTPTGSQSPRPFGRPAGSTERGLWSFVSTTAGPTKTPLPSSMRLVDQGEVLNLDPVADPDTGADIGAPPHDAVIAEHGLLTDLGEFPHGGAGTQCGRRVDLGPGRHPDRGKGHFTVLFHVLWNDPTGVWVRRLGPFAASLPLRWLRGLLTRTVFGCSYRPVLLPA